jgi:hypothetical protein
LYCAALSPDVCQPKNIAYEEDLLSNEPHVTGVKDTSMGYKGLEIEIIVRVTLNPTMGVFSSIRNDQG